MLKIVNSSIFYLYLFSNIKDNYSKLLVLVIFIYVDTSYKNLILLIVKTDGSVLEFISYQLENDKILY